MQKSPGRPMRWRIICAIIQAERRKARITLGTPIPKKKEKQIVSEKQDKPTPKRTSYMGLGLALGIALGAGMGLALDNMAFMGAGLAIGAGLDQRHKQDNA
jgi:hypothetical protein